MLQGHLWQPLGTQAIASTLFRCTAMVQPPTLILKCAAVLMNAPADQISASELCLAQLSHPCAR